MSNTTTTTPMIDSIKKRRAEGNRLEESVAGQLVRSIRDYQQAGVSILAEAGWLERQLVGVRARVLDGSMITACALDNLAKKVGIRQEAANNINNLSYMLSIDGDDFDALWNEIEAGIQQEVANAS
jgi:hypothetical protein